MLFIDERIIRNKTSRLLLFSDEPSFWYTWVTVSALINFSWGQRRGRDVDLKNICWEQLYQENGNLWDVINRIIKFMLETICSFRNERIQSVGCIAEKSSVADCNLFPLISVTAPKRYSYFLVWHSDISAPLNFLLPS